MQIRTGEEMISHVMQKLKDVMQVSEIKMEDDSERHAGHAGARAGGASHFKLCVVSERFAGLSPVARHRLVYDILAEEMAGSIHALNIVAKTPEEAAR